MFDREQFLKSHGWVEVDAPSAQLSSDALQIDSDAPVSPSLEAPGMDVIAKKMNSDQELILSAAEAFARARRNVRGVNVSESQMRDSMGKQPQTDQVEIINVVPASFKGTASDGPAAAGPGPKGIVVDKDRGIIGMQG